MSPLDRNQMLPIFLESAQEHFAGIEAALQQLQTISDDSEALENIRREFHSLKSSAKMMQLDAFSQWALEQELCYAEIIEQQTTPSPECLQRTQEVYDNMKENIEMLKNA